MYISQDNWWVVYDFGKKNCSEARPRRADVAARLEELWVDRVRQVSHPACIVLPNPSRISREPQILTPGWLIGGWCALREEEVLWNSGADLATRLE